MSNYKLCILSRPVSLYNGFSFVRASLAYAILKRTLGFEQSSDTITRRYFKLFTVPSFVL